MTWRVFFEVFCDLRWNIFLNLSNSIDWHESKGHVDFFRVSLTVGRQQLELAVWLQLFECLSLLSLLVIV